MNLKKSLLTILIPALITSCSFSKISLKLDYRPFPVTLNMSQNVKGNYGKVTFWPDKLDPFFDQNKNGNFELEDLIQSYRYIKKFNLPKEIKKRKNKENTNLHKKKFYLKMGNQLNFYSNKK